MKKAILRRLCSFAQAIGLAALFVVAGISDGGGLSTPAAAALAVAFAVVAAAGYMGARLLSVPKAHKPRAQRAEGRVIQFPTDAA